MLPSALRIVAAVVLLQASPASAGSESDRSSGYDATGFYASVAGNYSLEAFDSGGVSVGDGIGANARVGYRLHSRLAAEVQGEWGGKFDVAGSEIEVASVTVNANAYLLTADFQPYLSFGVGYMQLILPSVSNPDGLALRTGGGFDLYLSKQLGLNLDIDYVFGRGDVEASKYVSIGWGVFYRF